MSEIDLKGATIKGTLVIPPGVATVKNGFFASYDEGHLYKEEFDGMSLESMDGETWPERVERLSPALLDREPDTETRYKYKYNFTTGESSHETEVVEVVTVTLVVPEQEFQTTYPKDEWEEAVKNKTVGNYTDWWRSDIDSEIDSALLGPDGNVVSLW